MAARSVPIISAEAAATAARAAPSTAGEWPVHLGLRAFVRVYLAVVRLARAIGPAPRPVPADGAVVLVTGTFYSDNWVRSHVYPLARSSHCRRVVVVSTYPIPPMKNVEAIAPPRWLVRVAGSVVARLLVFACVGIRRRPHIVAGFHLLLNGLAAAVVARACGARAMYFCVGGPAETIGGGLYSDNRLFARLRTPDAVLERLLDRAVGGFDVAIAMGTGAVRHYHARGVRTPFHIVAGGIDGARFRAVEQHERQPIDLVFVGRLAPVKRLDVFLGAVRIVRQAIPDVRATIVGDGELRAELERLARELGVDSAVAFVGHQRDVEPWLRQAKVFVLASDSEGLALSLMEAMRCGVPAVVSRTGDLGDLVEDGVNGFLVADRTPEAFARPILELLRDGERRHAFGAAALHAASRYSVETVTRSWDDILAAAGGGSAVVAAEAR